MMSKIGLGILAAMAVLAAGCGSGDKAPDSASKSPDEAGKKKEFKITMIAKSVGNPVFLSAKVGAEAAAKELGEKNGVKITIDWRTPATEDGQVQAQKIAQAVNEGANAILLSCSDASKVNGSINDAVGKGVPVFTFDSDAPDSKRFGFYGAEDDAVGRQVMDELAKLANGAPLKIGILAGNENAPNLQARVKGVVDQAKKYPNVKVISAFYHPETPQDAAAEVIKDMNAYPEMNGWAMIGGWPLFTRALMTNIKPDQMKVVAVDALPAQLDYVDEGIVPVLLAQPTYDWGYKSVGFIVDKLILNKDVKPVNKMDLIKVTKTNLNDWAKQLEKWGFKEINVKYLDTPKKP